MAAAATAVPTALDTGTMGGVPVLLVKDNEINRMLTAWAMQAWGIEVTETVGGAEVVQLFNEQAFGVVLMDIQMPGMSGFEATVLLLQHPAAGRASIKVLARPATSTPATHATSPSA